MGGWATAGAQVPATSNPASSSPSAPDAARPSLDLNVPIARPAQPGQPLFFEADHIEGRPDERLRATGSVRLNQGDLTVMADEVTHSQADNTAHAEGQVRIQLRGDYYSGPSLTLRLDTMQGEFQQPSYRFARTNAGGHAELVEFLGNNRLRATQATYSSCTPENTLDGTPGEPDWVLKTRRVTLDVDGNEGRAEGAVIEFMGVPILGAPVLTFPLTDARKSGWLPPSFDINNKSGLELSMPYYWNIAPNRDLTLTPVLATRRGLGLAAEYRYLYPSDQGSLSVFGLPHDGLTGDARGLVDFRHGGKLTQAGSPSETRYDLRWKRVSDDDYWKDFSGSLPDSLTPRLYGSHATIERQFNDRDWGLGESQTTLYAGVRTWQTLRDLDPSANASTFVSSPYQREPQVGVISRGDTDQGWAWSVQGEFNRFTNEDPTKVQGERAHAVGTLERPMGSSSVQLTPRLSLRGVSYSLDQPLSNGDRSSSHVIPTVSLDTGVTLERPARMFGQDLTQTLEPRALYVYTPYKRQAGLPLFDTTPTDLNQYAIFNESDFTGVDRISDANQLTLGVSSRLIDPLTGGERARVGIFQKLLFSEQRVRPNDDPPADQNFSALLLMGSSHVAPNWSLDGTAQFSAENHATERALLNVRYSPGAWRTINLEYRYTRESSEQVGIGWQWPIAGVKPPLQDTPARQAAAASPLLNIDGVRRSECQGTWYAVGRFNYSTRDKRFSDALAGLEYDAGCWIGRFVAQRISLGRADVSTRFMFQLELVGLSRLGSNPLGTLKDNIPGYRLLRDDKSVLSTPNALPRTP